MNIKQSTRLSALVLSGALVFPSFAYGHAMGITAVNWTSGFIHSLMGLDTLLRPIELD
jgi:hydrogenase/urease accessory protein HupE